MLAGGVLVTSEEIRAAFGLLDPDHTGNVSLATLKKKLGVFFPDLAAKVLKLFKFILFAIPIIILPLNDVMALLFVVRIIAFL